MQNSKQAKLAEFCQANKLCLLALITDFLIPTPPLIFYVKQGYDH